MNWQLALGLGTVCTVAAVILLATGRIAAGIVAIVVGAWLDYRFARQLAESRRDRRDDR
ncbi:MAG: hypothetical protein IT520_14985 [Burkholderiales bacterium]|nr:hypothetical protein [Burkholderiales bacterium]